MMTKWGLFASEVILWGVVFLGFGANNDWQKIKAVDYDVNLAFGEVLPQTYDFGAYENSNFFQSQNQNEIEGLIHTTEALALPETRLELGKTAGVERTWVASGLIWVNTNNTSGYNLKIGAEKMILDDEKTQKNSQLNPFIPTSCDSQTPCTINQANIWVKSESYGAGYRIEGQDKTADWLTFEYFRPLVNLGQADSWPVTVAKNFQILVSDHNVKFNYLVRLDPAINGGTFGNKIGVYLVPNL